MAMLEVRDLVTEFPTRKGVVRAVDGVTFSIEKGEILAVVGGCCRSRATSHPARSPLTVRTCWGFPSARWRTCAATRSR